MHVVGQWHNKAQQVVAPGQMDSGDTKRACRLHSLAAEQSRNPNSSWCRLSRMLRGDLHRVIQLADSAQTLGFFTIDTSTFAHGTLCRRREVSTKNRRVLRCNILAGQHPHCIVRVLANRPTLITRDDHTVDRTKMPWRQTMARYAERT